MPANEKKWEVGTIRDIVSEVRYGSSRKAADGNSGQYPYLRMNNITYGGELDLTDTKTIDIPEEELPKCTVKRGDVLFNRTNSKELVGKTCVYNRDEMMVLAGFIVRVRLNERALPEFVSIFMNTDFSKQMLLNMCKTAIGQANINAQELQNIDIYIPPIEVQREFVIFKNQTDKSKLLFYRTLEAISRIEKTTGDYKYVGNFH
ncbi:MAG: restriction endonuclease subunit S [Thermoguttaceae bacterium]|nr:restriction endonuclease subunit S [Thermoguttaceae bacterium]